MRRFGDWLAIRKLGEGGQASVHLVRRIPARGLNNPAREFAELFSRVHGGEKQGQSFVELLNEHLAAFTESDAGALKVLHPPEKAKNPDTARARFAGEMDVLENVQHPNLIRLVDSHPAKDWFVMEYHRRGTLAQHRDPYRGKVTRSLSAFRDIVEAAAILHEREYVHRDIKPENTFLADDGRLVLGDLGLAFELGSETERLTHTSETAAAWQWAPIWAIGMRVEDVTPEFDTFCLGKVLWAMISGRHFLRAHYLRDKDFDLEVQFPDDPEIPFVNGLLDQCVAEKKGDGVPNARALLDQIDRLIALLSALPFQKEAGRCSSRELFPGRWHLDYTTANGHRGSENFEIDHNDNYTTVKGKVFSARVISAPAFGIAIFEKTERDGGLRFVETLRVIGDTERIGRDHLGNTVHYRRSE